MLVLRQISKAFQTPRGTVQALEKVSVTLPSKGIIGLLGPNGSGKTTLLRILMGLLSPDTGEVQYGDRPLTAETRRRFGYMPEERGLYPKMKAYDQLLYLLQLKGLSRAQAESEIAYWAERLETPWLDRPARALSKGMQQKVQLILALAGNPPVLLLDEPFSGLDPVVAAEVEVLLRELVQKGLLLILSTHRLEQVDELCDFVMLIHKGHLGLAGETEALRRQHWSCTYEVQTASPLSALSWPEGTLVQPLSSHQALIQLPSSYSSRSFLQELLSQTEITFFAEKLPTIKEIFLHTVSNL